MFRTAYYPAQTTYICVHFVFQPKRFQKSQQKARGVCSIVTVIPWSLPDCLSNSPPKTPPTSHSSERLSCRRLWLCTACLYSLLTFTFPLIDSPPGRLSVVSQYYEVDVNKEHVILGNSAIFKCLIPSFVADFVEVVSWTMVGQQEPEDTHVYSSNSYGLHPDSPCRIRVSNVPVLQQLKSLSVFHFYDLFHTCWFNFWL